MEANNSYFFIKLNSLQRERNSSKRSLELTPLSTELYTASLSWLQNSIKLESINCIQLHHISIFNLKTKLDCNSR